MSKTSLAAGLVGAICLLVAGHAAAQASNPDYGRTVAPGNPTDPNPVAVVKGTRNSRIQGPTEEARAAEAAAALTAAAQATATAAGTGCRVTGAVSPGKVGEAQAFEVTCATGPGYFLIATPTPQKFDCVELAGLTAMALERNPSAQVGLRCALPGNQNAVPVIAAYASEAGIRCTVDQATAFAKSRAGNVLYEIGCAGQDGYWLEKTTEGWQAMPCWDLAKDEGECRFTTPDETRSAWTSILAGTSASACGVEQSRRVGRDQAGLLIYEVKCSGSTGFMARIGPDNRAKQIHPCDQAANIGGGCTLTPVSAAAGRP